MKIKTANIVLIIVCLVIVAGLVMGLTAGPNYGAELRQWYTMTITAGNVPFDMDEVEAAVQATGVTDVQIRQGGTAIGDQAIITFADRFGKQDDVMRTLAASYPDATSSGVELLSPAQNVAPELWKSLIAAGGMLAIAFLYGIMRYEMAGALQLLLGMLVDMAFPLALAVIIQLPLAYGYPAVVGCFGALSLLLRTDLMNRLNRRLKSAAKRDDRTEIFFDAFKSGQWRALLPLAGAVLLFAVAQLFGGLALNRTLNIFAVLGLVTTAFGYFCLTPAYYGFFGKK